MDIEGFPVLETIPDFADNPSSSAKRGFSMVGLSAARRVIAYRAKRVTEGFSHKFVFPTRAAVASFEQFFEGRSGRWEPFWMPSWRADLLLAQDVAQSDVSAIIAAVGYESIYDPASADTKALGHYLYMLKPDLTVFAPRVTSLGLSLLGTEKLNLGSAAPAAFPILSTVVCFLHFVRFASDDLEIRYAGPNAATCEAGFIGVTSSQVEADA